MWGIFRKHIVMIAAVTLIAAVVGFLLAAFVVPKQYTSVFRFYITDSDTAVEKESADINSSTQLANTCCVLFTADTMLNSIKADTALGYTNNQLASMIAVTSLKSTRAMELTVTAQSAEDAFAIAEAVSERASDYYNSVIKTSTIAVYDTAKLNKIPVSPSKKVYTAAGFVIGFICSFVAALIYELFNITIKTEDDLFGQYEIPVFAEIVNLNAGRKGVRQ